MTGVFDEERFCFFRFLKRESDRKRDQEENAVERQFNSPQRSDTQNVSQDIPYRRLSERMIIGEDKSAQ